MKKAALICIFSLLVANSVYAQQVNQTVNKASVTLVNNAKNQLGTAYAENSIEARKLVLEKLGYNHEDLCGEPREINAKEGFVKYGGG